MLLFYLSLIDTEKDKQKFEKIYYEHRKFMMQVALKILKDEMLAEDAVTDAFIRLIKYLNKIENIYCEKTKMLIFLITKSAAIDNLRKANKHRIVSLEDVEDMPAENEDVMEDINVEEIVKKLKEMPEIYREVLEMKLYYGFSAKEISKALNITYSTARKRLEHGRKYFAKLLGEE